jgi:hypothetical protein
VKPRHRPHGIGELLFAHERDGVDRDALAADVVAVGLGDGALRDHADLRAAADDDHALAVDGLKRRHRGHVQHARHRLDVGEQAVMVKGPRDLELDLGGRPASRPARDVADVRAVPEDDFRYPVEDAGLVAALEEQPGRFASRHRRRT